MLRYICNDCGYDTGNLDFWLIYRKEGKIIEQPGTDFDPLFEDFRASDLKGYVYYYFCEDCNKIIKVYTISDRLTGSERENNIEEIKEYMKYGSPQYTIKTFKEKINIQHTDCPNCHKKIFESKEYGHEIKKCLKCGSNNLFRRRICD